MEGPHDPHQPDAGATEPVAQDGDLHALLERLLGQGDVRPADPGAADALWPDLFPVATAIPDDVSTIVPAPEALTGKVTAPVEARAWEPLVIDSPADSTNVDDIHAAILASVSVDLEPIAQAPVAEAATESTADPAPTEAVLGEVALTEALLAEAWPTEAWPTEAVPSDAVPSAALSDVVMEAEATFGAPGVATEPVAAPDVTEPGAFELTEPAASEPVETVDLPAEVEPTPISSDFIDSLFAADPTPVSDPGETEAAPAAFSLTPFDAVGDDSFVDMGLDVEALWAAAVPELGLEAAPLLDLDDDEPAAPTAVVLPWPSHEPKAEAAPGAGPGAGKSPQDLIEAALAGLHADLTAEPVEPLRTPDVAAATAHVVFRLGSRIMAIPLAAVSEIARPPRTTRLPHVPAWVLGIANLRGDIVSMLDLEGFFSGKTGNASHEQRMLALRPAGDEVRTAVLVDAVDGIQAFEDARISRVTRGYDAEVSPYARGLYQREDELVVVLDAERLLQSKPMRQFEDGAGAR